VLQIHQYPSLDGVEDEGQDLQWLVDWLHHSTMVAVADES